ncbi:MAG: hypothetical protein C0608_04700 [Deltaproteobacteria bacterium]|nr:MAG: hypothetical protein C0608_04700 [Deltaproteobacteria bacterium]
MNKTLSLFIHTVLALLIASPALAITPFVNLKRCASIPGDIDRLECYDNYVRHMGIPTPANDGTLETTQARYGKWTTRTELDPDGGSSVFVYAYSNNLLSGRSGIPVAPLLVARCQEMVTEFFLAYPLTMHLQPANVEQPALYSIMAGQKAETSERKTIFIGEDRKDAVVAEPRRVRIAFNDGTRFDETLKSSTDGRAWFFTNPVSAIRRIARHSDVSLSPPDGGGIEMGINFDLEGFEEALVPLRNSCTW